MVDTIWPLCVNLESYLIIGGAEKGLLQFLQTLKEEWNIINNFKPKIWQLR